MLKQETDIKKDFSFIERRRQNMYYQVNITSNFLYKNI